MTQPLRPRHQAHPHASSPPSWIDDAEFDAILERAADTLARHGGSAHQYGISVYRLGYRVRTLAYAVAGAAVAVALAAAPHPAGSVVALCALFAMARAAISWFPMDVPGAEITVTGRGHGLLAITAFGAITAAALRIGRYASIAFLSGAAIKGSAVVGTLMIVSLLAMAVLRRSAPAQRYFGAVERAFYLLVTVSLIIVSVVLLVRN